jgi:hypothetical protein
MACGATLAISPYTARNKRPISESWEARKRARVAPRKCGAIPVPPRPSAEGEHGAIRARRRSSAGGQHGAIPARPRSSARGEHGAIPARPRSSAGGEHGARLPVIACLHAADCRMRTRRRHEHEQHAEHHRPHRDAVGPEAGALVRPLRGAAPRLRLPKAGALVASPLDRDCATAWDAGARCSHPGGAPWVDWPLRRGRAG